MEDCSIINKLSQTNQIVVYCGGKTFDFFIEDEGYKVIAQSFLDMCAEFREMPAFGVALHNECVNALNDGVWVEFLFANRLSHNEMFFDSLLVNVEKENSGFNLIRKVDGEYCGRCFYVDLVCNDMSNFYSCILNSISH